MTFYISPFVLGIICTIGAEIIALFLTIFFSALKGYVKSRRNRVDSSRRDENE